LPLALLFFNILGFQPAGFVVMSFFTQGVAVGLRYISLSGCFYRIKVSFAYIFRLKTLYIISPMQNAMTHWVIMYSDVFCVLKGQYDFQTYHIY
jgi:hypothetical protein